MRLGVVWPQTAIPADPATVRTFAQAIDELGFDHVLIYDHVVGADPAGHPGWSGFFDVESEFHEPLVFYGYLAALTGAELVTSILVLPQRQTTLVAKQAAELDVLTGGRLRLVAAPRTAQPWRAFQMLRAARAARPTPSAMISDPVAVGGMLSRASHAQRSRSFSNSSPAAVSVPAIPRP
jgi:alkanesulfonate monooxygenase SsuD/methylene tetrahydromethanopterin reductase-like flavin-dependent oxidoreductase (luciferase family)